MNKANESQNETPLNVEEDLAQECMEKHEVPEMM